MSPSLQISASPSRSIWSSPNSKDLRVTVRRDHLEESLSISSRALKACPALKDELTDGSIILNFDPLVFRIIVEYLDNGRGLDRLIQGPQILLSFAKAWHIARVLELSEVLNRLIDIFRQEYIRLLHNELQIEADGEPFIELRNYIGLYTAAEKFLVDFHAGIWRREKDVSERLERMPPDIGRHIEEQWKCLVDSDGAQDRILHVSDYFKLDKKKLKERRWRLYTKPPTVVSRPSSSRLGTSPSLVHTANHEDHTLSHSQSTNSLMGRMKVRLEGIFSVNGEPVVLAEPRVIPDLMETFRPDSAVSDRAPFMPPTLEEGRRRAKEMAEEDSTDSSGSGGPGSLTESMRKVVGEQNDAH
ncbi:hypothetical protein P154DRAFT_583028 [Amniculicola lignicola CBS 123094]|uniref:BTB domain-containing protein n=1 Tax=Amniculicola lignicola CBS 123094 TaxID=1392246 RepID=A0A6A5W270_9PLEO|nr:hypothetical protein P154DRAFT_583028 [Amniculicola lignicola CBS 123094]